MVKAQAPKTDIYLFGSFTRSKYDLFLGLFLGQKKDFLQNYYSDLYRTLLELAHIQPEGQSIILSDGSILKILDYEGTDPSDWEPGHTVMFWRPENYPQCVYRLVNLDQVSSIRILFTGRN